MNNKRYNMEISKIDTNFPFIAVKISENKEVVQNGL